ncbi:OmpA family protein [Flammeovirgaceae bacterium SG7u.111]|nr:OmpA family protein [Flammeovirgaceae bacterium SG7u.132]WPO38101.1 OmpA family protein [Flammeovirgaceae bacterium SG7u.111]
MTKKVLLFLSAVFMSMLTVSAQDIQWANEVLDFSSELHNVEFAANQALGKPNVYPAGEENPNAWVPSRDNKKDFVKVGFANPMKIRQVAVAESFNAGTTYKIELFDASGQKRDTYEFETILAGFSRMKTVQFNMTDYEVAAVKVYVDSKAVPGFTAIDAIGITASEEPFDMLPDVHEDVEQNLLVERLGRNINSSFADFRPIVSPDKKKLYFSRKNHPQNYGGIKDLEDIWYSDWDENEKTWGIAKNLGQPLNNLGPNYISCFTPDGESMGIVLGNAYKNNEQMKFGISIAWKEGDTWGEPEKLNIDKFNNFSDKANFFMANNRKVMIISMEQSDSKGERDLYVSFLADDNVWSKPQRMGDMLNTITDESGPFLAADDKTLYFSSAGFSGFGKSDIYVTKRLDDTWLNWSEPKNLGERVNSKEDDLFFHMLPKGEEAYFTRSVEYSDYDIFRVPMPIFFKPSPVATINGKIFNSATGEPMRAKVIYETIPEGKEVGYTYSNAVTGEYTIMLPEGEKYAYRAEVEGMFVGSQTIDLSNLNKNVEYTHDLAMMPNFKENMKLPVEKVFYGKNAITIPADKINDLEAIIEKLRNDPELSLTIKGHTDADGSKLENIEVSKQRAKAIVDYLIHKGIEESRLDWMGVGASEPLASNLDEREGKELNRRVELKMEREVNTMAVLHK